MKKKPTCYAATLVVLFAVGCKNNQGNTLSTYLAEEATIMPIPSQQITVQTDLLSKESLDTMSESTFIFNTETRVSPTTPASNKERALLVVQQHGGSEETELSLQQLGDWLASALGAGAFSVVNPHDVIGTVQNVGPWGEKMPESSATALAEKIGTPVLLTASVTDARLRHIGGTDPGVQAIFEFTLSAKSVPGGDLLASVNVTTRSRKIPSEISFRQNATTYWAEIAKNGAYNAAPALCKEWEKAHIIPPSAPMLVHAVFASNILGATLRIDGVAYGTFGRDPLALSISPGLHNVEIAYPGYIAFEDLAMIQEGSSFGVVLQLNAEGQSQYRRDAFFHQECDRIKREGITEGLIQALVKKGQDKYLEVSSTTLEDVFKVFLPDNGASDESAISNDK